MLSMCHEWFELEQKQIVLRVLSHSDTSLDIEQNVNVLHNIAHPTVFIDE
jgi:hypothetical protein